MELVKGDWNGIESGAEESVPFEWVPVWGTDILTVHCDLTKRECDRSYDGISQERIY